MFPTEFGADDIGIPESGNGVPDILDEARYEIAWFLTMQRGDGGFWFKITHEQFEGFVMPQSDTSPLRYIYGPSSTATGDAVAVLAKAARLFSTFDAAFSRTCLDAANSGWQYLLAHPVIVPSGGFRNPPGTGTGEYGDGNDSDERLWAAAELFETTGDAAYNGYFTSSYTSGSLFGGAMWWGDVRPLALLTYLNSAQPAASASIKTSLAQALHVYCNGQVTKRNGSGYHSVLYPGDYVWGSNSGALNAAVLLLAGASKFHDTTFAQVAADQLHYVLGVNGLSRSFVTGLGENPPRQPHHRPSASDGVTDPVPGLLAGGPNQSRQDVVLQALFTSSTPPGLCYADSLPSYASNEIAINWNAPLVFVAGYFRGVAGPTGLRGDQLPARDRFRLEQNFPNPFNGATRIRFELASRETLEMRVVDVIGQEVAALPLGDCAPGLHEILWEANDPSGHPLSSGVYFYSIKGNVSHGVRKLVLMK
jgi:endoglucanase